MIVTPATHLAAAGRLFWRDRAALGAMTGMFVFLPAFAALLLSDPIPPPPAEPREQAAVQAWTDAMMVWGRSNAAGYVVSDLIGLFGVAAIALLLLSPDRPSVAEALRMGARRIVRFAVVSLLVAVPVGLGLWVFVLPGLYVQARLLLAIPVLAAEPALGVGAALTDSMWATRGRGLAITGALVALFLAQWIVAVPLMSADEWLRSPGNGNPLVLALVDAGIAAAGAAWHVGTVLVGIVVYRSSKGN